MNDQTLEETTAQSRRPVHRLTYALSYDDLLQDDACAFRLDKLPLRLTRSAGATRVAVEDGKILLSDRWMSSEHATIERRGDALVVKDEGSRNGTWVNGARISEHRLADGDLLEVGHSLLVYRFTDESAIVADPDAAQIGPTRTLCPEVAALARDISRIAPSREPMLILGETGTGKEVIAEAVHRASGRTGELCAVDCGAVPETLFEATFFGHKRGAFTGATDARVGEIVRAHHGTLMLDEVGNMSAPAQAKLLRALEDGQVTPIGASEKQAVDVRWIAATNRDVLDDGEFRSDLIARLAGFVARIPPLRARREDLGILSAYLLKQAGAASASITALAARRLFTSAFPGNVRELRATLRSATLLAAGKAIDIAHLPAPRTRPTEPPDEKSDEKTDHASVEAALEAHGGNVVRAAKALGTHPRQVYRWIERYAISLDRYRR